MTQYYTVSQKKPDTRIMVNNFQQTSGTINAIWPNCLPLL